MSGDQRLVRMLRWYPSTWRDRYGDEMAALLEDTHGMNRMPFKGQLSLARAGSLERARAFGLLGDATGPEERIRAGSLLILSAWALFMVAGPIFAKFTDNWYPATPRSDRWLPNDAFVAVQWGGVVGVALVFSAAIFVLPAFIRFLRAGGWPSVRGHVVRGVLAVTVAAGTTLGIAVWAHQLSSQARNGGSWTYGAAFLLWAALGVASIAMGTGAAISVGRRLELSQSSWRLLGGVALALSTVMAVMIAGTVTWWAAMAASAPQVLANGIGNGIPFTSSTLPPILVVASFLMFIGLVLAAIGTLRVVRSLPRSVVF